jgi:hypothetical protein
MTTFDTMVHYMATRSAEHEAPEQPQSPDLMAELAAMQKIGTALTELRDSEARFRVLRWAEGFSGAPGAPASVPVPTAPTARTAIRAAASAPRGPDTTLTLDGYDLFGDAPSDEPPPLRAPGVAEETLDSMVKGLVADFHQIARDWHGDE